jgi:hypothetical protein
VRASLRRFASEVGDTQALGLVRVLLGCFLFRQAFNDLNRLSEIGYFGDLFHMPFFSDSWLLPRSAYALLLAAQLVAATLAVVGEAARPALFVSGLSGVYLLLCDRLQYHHHRYSLYLFALIISFAPCDRCFRPLQRWRRSPVERTGPLWAQRLAQLQLSIIYVASAGTKLLDVDWRSGAGLADRFLRFADEAARHGVPRRLMALLAAPLPSSALAKLAIGTELFLAFALFRPRTRAFALWWGLAFHATIDITSTVDIFSWLSVTILMLFAVPDFQARTLAIDRARRSHRLVARVTSVLDWLARFGGEEVRGQPLTVIDRDGTRARGVHALVLLCRGLPILFPLWGPLWLLTAPARARRPRDGP